MANPKSISQRLADIDKEEQYDYNADMLELFLEGDQRPVSYSSMKKFFESPRKMWEHYFQRDTGSTPATTTGKLFEIMLLERGDVDERVFIYPEYNLRTKADKQAKLDFEAMAFEKTREPIFVKEKEIANAFEMYRSAINTDEIQEMLENTAAVQETVYFTDPITKLRCVAKVDIRTSFQSNPFKIIDLKTGVSADPRDWPRAVTLYDYWLQGGAYVEAYANTQFIYGDYYWLVVESSPPYGVNLLKADDAMINEARRIWKAGLTALKYCIESKQFHKSHSFWRVAPYDITRAQWIKTRL